MPMTDAAAPNLRRKLTTIFCADVQGYSTLVEADEVGTVNRLKQYRAVMTAEIERNHGRVINPRSEKTPEGKECVRTFSSRWLPSIKHKKITQRHIKCLR